MSQRRSNSLRRAVGCAAIVAASSTTFAADPSPFPTVAFESGGKLRAEVHPATVADGETVILKAPGLLLELPKDAVDDATRPDALLVEYASRAEKVADAAPDHFALAQWCKENDLDPERQFHLERTIAFDPDHAEARKALGYSKIDGKWIHPEQSMIDAGYVRYRGSWRSKMEMEQILAEEKAEEIRRGYLRDMLNWRRQALRDEPHRTEAVLNFQRVTDPLAVFALGKMLEDEKLDALRSLYVDVLGRIPGGEANGLLARVATTDDIGRVREAAIERLAARGATAVTPALIAQLYSDNPVQINRAAVVLGRLGDERAVPALIDVLVTEHKQAITTGSPGGIGTAFGGGGGNSVGGISAGSSTRVVTARSQNGEVLGALNAITGENFQYDQNLWKRWYSEQRNVKNVNLRELPR